MDTNAARIYVVEDDAEVGNLIRAVLLEAGFEATLFSTAARLRNRLGRTRPDLCIVDLGLPDVDGMELVRDLRREAGCGVMILTGRGFLEDRVRGLELGADDYMIKPFEPRELVARVNSILRRLAHGLQAAPCHGKCAHFAGCRFDLATQTLTGADGAVHNLSLAEAHLLRVLLERPNRILSREELLGERDLSPFDRSIDVRVSRLRKKIEPSPEHPRVIKTVYGAGYLLNAEVDWVDAP